MPYAILLPDGGKNPMHSDSHAAVNHENDRYDLNNLQVGTIIGTSELHARYLLPIVSDSIVTGVGFRFRFKEQSTGKYTHRYMRMNFLDRKRCFTDPNSLDGHFIRHKMFLSNLINNLDVDAGNSYREATAGSGILWRTNWIGGQKTWAQEIVATGVTIDKIAIACSRWNGTRVGETVKFQIFELLGSGTNVYRGALLGETESIDYNSMSTNAFGAHELDMLVPYTPTAGQRLALVPLPSWQATGGSQLRMLGYAGEIDEFVTVGETLFAPVGDGYNPQGAYHRARMWESRDYPKDQAPDVSPAYPQEIDLVGEWGWDAAGNIVDSGAGESPVDGDWYSINSVEIPELLSKLQAYIDDPEYDKDTNNGIGVMLTKSILDQSLAKYYSYESGSPPELWITWNDPDVDSTSVSGVARAREAISGTFKSERSINGKSKAIARIDGKLKIV